MTAEHVPYTPPAQHETDRVRAAIERHKARQNARDAQRRTAQ